MNFWCKVTKKIKKKDDSPKFLLLLRFKKK